MRTFTYNDMMIRIRVHVSHSRYHTSRTSSPPHETDTQRQVSTPFDVQLHAIAHTHTHTQREREREREAVPVPPRVPSKTSCDTAGALVSCDKSSIYPFSKSLRSMSRNARIPLLNATQRLQRFFTHTHTHTHTHTCESCTYLHVECIVYYTWFYQCRLCSYVQCARDSYRLVMR